MNKNRLPILIVVVSLIAVSILAAWTFQRTTGARVDNVSLAPGMGDLRYYESQQILPDTGGVASERAAYAGMGDLHVAERERAIEAWAAESRSVAPSGVEEARALEQREQTSINTENLKQAGENGSDDYVGMGDLRRAEREAGLMLDGQALTGGLVPLGDPANSPEDSSGVYNGMGDLRRVDR